MDGVPIDCPNRRLAALALALLGAAAKLGFGQSSPDVKAILEGVTRAYENQRQYDVSGISTTEEYSVKGKGVIKAKFRIANRDPNKFRLEQENSVEIDGSPNDTPFGPMVIIGDGNDVWGIDPTPNHYKKFRTSDLPRIHATVEAAKSAVFAPLGMLEKGAANTTLIRDELLALDGKNVACFVLRVILPDRPESTTFWVEKTRFIVRRVRLDIKPSADTQGLGLSTTTEFLVVNIGVALPESTFVFTPSPSATEVDKLKL